MVIRRHRNLLRIRPVGRSSAIKHWLSKFPARYRLDAGRYPVEKKHPNEEVATSPEPEEESCIMLSERAPIPGYVKLPPSTVGFGGPLVSLHRCSKVSRPQRHKAAARLSTLLIKMNRELSLPAIIRPQEYTA